MSQGSVALHFQHAIAFPLLQANNLSDDIDDFSDFNVFNNHGMYESIVLPLVTPSCDFLESVALGRGFL